ncbi:uncharacterized protein LOC134285295 [Aedes albopictus]|uniref:CCHC-type domain-containing protein n=1 Tax=Aedes albopictus TaxID=7160 RepID=A0ABM1ZGP2_AEDAL
MSSSVAFTMEPYRRGASFADWYTRMKYFFRVNQEGQKTCPVQNTSTTLSRLGRWLGQTADQQQGGHPSSISAVINGSNQQLGVAATRLAKVYELARKHNSGETGSGRGPVKSRLGTRPSGRWQQPFRGGRPSESGGSHRQDGRPDGYRQWLRPDYSQMTCHFCGLKGHIRKKCFRLKNMNREAVNLVDSAPGPSSDVHISELLQRMRANDDESDNSDSDMCWKRGRNGSQEADQSM